MKSIVRLCLTVSALALLFMPSASAEGPTWSYIEGGYNNIDIDNLDDGDGYFLGGSFGSEKWHLFGRYQEAETDAANIDVNKWYAGAGWHGGLGDKADLFAELAYVDAEIGMLSDSGFFARGGARWRPISLFELGGAVRYEDVGDLDDATIFEANALLHIWRIAIGVSLETESDVDTYNGFVRFNFGGGR